MAEQQRMTWIELARAELGVKEVTGTNGHNATIVSFFAEVGHPEIDDDETAWCAAFVGSMLKRAGYPHTGMLTARSYLKYGKKLDGPREGCIVVLKRGNSSWQGHVGFVIGWNSRQVKVLGGNQSNAVSIQNYSIDKVLGYRWPVAPTSKDLKDAGSTEIAMADKIGTASKIVVGTGAATKAAEETGALDPLKDATGDLTAIQQFGEGVNAVVTLVSANLWVAAIVLGVGGWLLARWWRNHRVERHLQGQPLSVEA